MFYKNLTSEQLKTMVDAVIKVHKEKLNRKDLGAQEASQLLRNDFDLLREKFKYANLNGAIVELTDPNCDGKHMVFVVTTEEDGNKIDFYKNVENFYNKNTFIVDPLYLDKNVAKCAFTKIGELKGYHSGLDWKDHECLVYRGKEWQCIQDTLQLNPHQLLQCAEQQQKEFEVAVTNTIRASL